MPRRRVLSEIDQQTLLSIPNELAELSKHYLLSEADISIINQRRGSHNKIGFAILLCCIHYPGIIINTKTNIPIALIEFIANQLNLKEYTEWRKYFNRETTRLEHVAELRQFLNFKTFTVELYNQYLNKLIPLAKQTDKGITIAEALISYLRQNLVISPDISVIERLCSEAITIGSQEFYLDLISGLSENNKLDLDNLLKIKPPTKISYLHWLLGKIKGEAQHNYVI